METEGPGVRSGMGAWQDRQSPEVQEWWHPLEPEAEEEAGMQRGPGTTAGR